MCQKVKHKRRGKIEKANEIKHILREPPDFSRKWDTVLEERAIIIAIE